MMFSHYMDHFPEILAVVSHKKQSVSKMLFDLVENKQVRSRAHGSIIPARKGNRTNELYVVYHPVSFAAE